MSMLYGELTSPTAVIHAIKACLIVPDEENLILAKSNLLQIFRIQTSVRETRLRHSESGRNVVGDAVAEMLLSEDGGEDFMGDDSQVQLLLHENVGQLILVHEIKLSGTVTGIVNTGRMQNVATDADCIAISFEDAKVSVLFWEQEVHSLTTLSIHFYERESHKSPFSDSIPPHLFKDYHSRCLILRAYTDVYAILPIRQPDDDIDDAVEPDMARPYYPSFVVNASQLEESIAHVIDEAFLYEYREPTLAILYAGIRTSTGLLEHRKDTVSLVAVTLDLQQRASTTIFSIQGLPYDCFAVIPLPPPVGGLLVLGINQVIHVDEAGRRVAVGVNSFAEKSTAFHMNERPELQLALEGAIPVSLENEDGDVLLALRNSTFVQLRFNRDGRNVTDIQLETLEISRIPEVGIAGFGCAVLLQSERVFLGSTTGDSILVGYTSGAKCQEAGAVTVGMNDTVDDLDDIYGDDENNEAPSGVKGKGKMRLLIHDYLFSTAPIRDAVFAPPSFSETATFLQKDVISERELVCTTNCDTAGAISIFRKSIIPSVVARLPAPNFISFATLRTKPVVQGMDLAPLTADFDQYLLASRGRETVLYKVVLYKVAEVFEEVRGSEFNTSGATIASGTLLDGALWAQVVSGVIRIYNNELGVHQWIPITDEEFGPNSKIRSASVMDPWVLLVLESGRVVVYEINLKTQDMEVHAKMSLLEGEFICGCIFQGRKADFLPNDVVRRMEPTANTKASLKRKREMDEDADLYGESEVSDKRPRSSKGAEVVQENGFRFETDKQNATAHALKVELDWLFCLVSQAGVLEVRRLVDFELLFRCDDFAAFPDILCNGEDTESGRRIANTIEEILLANLGDTHVEPHLLVRTELNDLIIYKPYQYTEPGAATSTLRFCKVFNPHLTRDPIGDVKADEDLSLSPTRMFALPNVSGFSVVFLCGPYPGFVLKTSQSVAHFHNVVGKSIRSVCPLNVMDGVQDGFLYYDSTGVIRICKLPTEFTFHGNWSVRRIQRGKDLSHLEYFESHGLFAMSVNTPEEFLLVDDEGQPKEVPEDPLEILPTTSTSSLELVHPVSWKTVDIFPLSKYETIVSMKQVDLQISEESKRRRPFLAVGTAVLRGEDAGLRGTLYVFDISQVVPQPGRPETNRKLRLAWSEEVRGAVTVVNELRGYLLSSQGQKIMVRSYGEEDKEFLPVAFYDLSMVVTIAQSIRDFVLFGDIMHSICFIGFQEQPYRMTLLGRDHEKLEISCGDFVVEGETLFFAVADGERNIHIFQYDPENPQSLSGNRLIRKADFHVGHFVTKIMRARKIVPGESEHEPTSFLGLTTSRDGHLGFITAINERVYRRLNILQGQIINNEEQPAALNPRSYRLSTHEAKTANPARGILDGEILRQFTHLSGQRRAEYAKKSGISVARLLGDLVDIERSMPYL